MDNNVLIFLTILIFLIITRLIVGYVRNKVYKPEYDHEVQKPGKLERFILNLLIFLTGFSLFFAIIGVLMEETEMALVFGVLTSIFFVVVIILKRALNTSYQENPDYFILKVKGKAYQVFYDDIINWRPAYNEIAILDKTKQDKKYIKVNIKIFKPEILLRKIADMAFAGKFYDMDQANSNDPNRELETTYYLVDNHYGYLVEDYVKKIKNKSQ